MNRNEERGNNSPDISQGGIELDVPTVRKSIGTWKIVETEGPGPGRRSGHTMNSLWVNGEENGGLFVLGGISRIRDKVDQLFGGNHVKLHKSTMISGATYLLNIKTLMWTPLHLSGDISDDDIPTPRGHHTSVVVNGNIYVYGSDLFDCDSIFRLDFQNNTWKRLNSFGDRPPRLAHHTSFTYGDVVYVHGGSFLPVAADRPLNTSRMYSFDTTLCKWQLLQTTSDDDFVCDGLAQHTSVVSGDDVYIFGGITDGSPTSRLLKFNIPKKHWTVVETKNSPKPRSAHVSCIWRNYMIVVGGVVVDEPCPDLLIYNMINQTWLPKVYLLSSPTVFYSACAIGHDTLYVYGGDSPCGNRSASLHSIHLPSLLGEKSTSCAGHKTYQKDVTEHYNDCRQRALDDYNSIM